MDYYQHERFSNSFLSRIKMELTGRAVPLQNAHFYSTGKEFEDCLLFHHPTDNKIVKAMVRETKKHPTFIKLFGDRRIKLQHEWYGTFKGLPFKGKADGVIKGVIVPDIKSTSCNTYDKFLESVEEYDYDMQMYHYTEFYKCNLSCLIATTKSLNPKVFVVPIDRGSYIWERGKEKSNHLISVIKSL